MASRALRYEAAGLFGEAAECGFGQPDLISADHAVVGDQQGGEQHLFALERSSTRLKPRKTSGRNALDWREITTTFSRPVSRLTRLTFNCGRDEDSAFIDWTHR